MVVPKSSLPWGPLGSVLLSFRTLTHGEFDVHSTACHSKGPKCLLAAIHAARIPGSRNSRAYSFRQRARCAAIAVSPGPVQVRDSHHRRDAGNGEQGVRALIVHVCSTVYVQGPVPYCVARTGWHPFKEGARSCIVRQGCTIYTYLMHVTRTRTCMSPGRGHGRGGRRAGPRRLRPSGAQY